MVANGTTNGFTKGTTSSHTTAINTGLRLREMLAQEGHTVVCPGVHDGITTRSKFATSALGRLLSSLTPLY